MTPALCLQQISLSLSRERHVIAPASKVSRARQERDAHSVTNGVFEMNKGDFSPFALQERFSPFNICATSDFLQHVQDAHKLLDKALIDVVDRWFSDKEADFPQRMPLQKNEEDLLRWIDGAGKSTVPSFDSHYGMWRTDFLIERSSSGHEQAKVCEINARIPYNGFWVIGQHEEVTNGLVAPSQEEAFHSPNNFDTTKETIYSCFDRHKPIHYIRKKWPGVDGPMFARDFEQRTGQKVILTDPSELRLQADDQSPTGYSLYRQPNGTNETQQQVHQCTFELFQEEYAEIDPLILQQMATCGVNDLRNVFLLHDKRILGIVLDELPRLETRNVLSRDECSRLEAAIADTLLPGSERLKDLLHHSLTDTTLKDQYIVKPIRDAAGRGIRPGSLFTQPEWLTLLEHQSHHALTPNEDACVIQRLVNHVQYEIVRHGCGDATTPEYFHLIGSQHLINSKLSVHGPWRLGNELGHLGVSKSDSRPASDLGIIMSTIVRPDGMDVLEEQEG